MSSLHAAVALIAAPGPDTEIQAGDYLVVVGMGQGIEKVGGLLHKG